MNILECFRMLLEEYEWAEHYRTVWMKITFSNSMNDNIQNSSNNSEPSTKEWFGRNVRTIWIGTGFCHSINKDILEENRTVWTGRWYKSLVVFCWSWLENVSSWCSAGLRSRMKCSLLNVPPAHRSAATIRSCLFQSVSRTVRERRRTCFLQITERTFFSCGIWSRA